MAQASPQPVDWLARAREAAEVLRREGLACERAGTLTDPTIDALARTGLFSIAVPRALGGGEQGFEMQLAVYEALARADGSAGWCLMASATASAFAASYCGPDAARAMFEGRPWVAHAGQFAPRGQGRAVDGGFDVTGDYSFGSGAAYASWIAAGFIAFEGDAPRMRPSGLPEMRVAFLPRERVQFRGNWHVAGLQGTGSFDYGVKDQRVEEDFTFPLLEAAPRHGGDFFRCGVLPITAGGHAGFALGVGRRALDEIAAVAHGKTRMGAPTSVAGDARFQYDYARAEAKLSAARALVFESFGELERDVLAGNPPSLEGRARVRIATTWATEVAAEVADFAYKFAGTDSLRLPSDLQRAWRDIHAGTQHVFVSDRTYLESAQVLLGLAPGDLAL